METGPLACTDSGYKEPSSFTRDAKLALVASTLPPAKRRPLCSQNVANTELGRDERNRQTDMSLVWAESLGTPEALFPVACPS